MSSGHRATEDGPHAGDQLRWCERLGHVVVGPGFKPADALACRAQGREHDDRDAGFLAGNPGHGGAVHVWQHQIENHQCWLGLPHELERGQTIGGDHHLEAGPFEIKPDQVRDLGVVVDDQHKVLATWYGFQITHNGDREPD